MQQLATTQQIIQIHTLLPEQIRKDKELKADLIRQFTGDEKKCSTRDLTYHQAKELIARLQELKKDQPKDARSDKMRKKIISMAHDMGWQKTNAKGRLVADMQRIENWVLKFGHKHTALNDYTYEELPILVSQFEEVYKHHLTKI